MQIGRRFKGSSASYAWTVNDTYESNDKAKASNEAAKASAMNDAVGSLLGSTSGLALRQTLKDLDSTDLILKVVSKEGRALRHAAAQAVGSAIGAPVSRFLSKKASGPDGGRGSGGSAHALEAGTIREGAFAAVATADAARPVSEVAKLLRQRQSKWKRKVALCLLQVHLTRQLQRGRQGALALASLLYLSVRILVGGLRQAALQTFRTAFRRNDEGTGEITAAAPE